MQLVSRRFVVRPIEPSDRERHASRLTAALNRADAEEAEVIRRHFEQWEKEQGQSREQLVCPVCGDGLLTPTVRRTSRPHKRRKPADRWAAVYDLRSQIKTLEAELDRLLASLDR